MTGVTFPAGDPDALAEAVDSAARRPRVRPPGGQAGPAPGAETYNWRSIARRTVAVYDAAVADVGALTMARTEAIVAGAIRPIR